MTIEECYQELGGNYAEVCTRLPSPRLVEKFVGKFLDDHSYETLVEQIAAGNRAEAFRAAHTMKGVCANLSFTRLFASASALTEALRLEGEVIPAEALSQLDEVRRDYQTNVDAIRRFLAAALAHPCL